MAQVTASELLILDKKRFDTEHYSWQEYAIDSGWWGYAYESFKEKCKALGISVDDITFRGFCSQGDGAAFKGDVNLSAFMEREGLDVTYPALYIGIKNDNSRVHIRYSSNNCMRVGEYAMYANQTAPDGIFSDLDQQAWEELIDEQESEACIEDLVLSFAQDLASELYDDLEREYEHLISEESFIESCECNEITFEINTEEVEL